MLLESVSDSTKLLCTDCEQCSSIVKNIQGRNEVPSSCIVPWQDSRTEWTDI